MYSHLKANILLELCYLRPEVEGRCQSSSCILILNYRVGNKLKQNFSNVWTLIVLVLVICINIFAFEPNLHISQMTSFACKMLGDVINMHNLQKYYANI